MFDMSAVYSLLQQMGQKKKQKEDTFSRREDDKIVKTRLGSRPDLVLRKCPQESISSLFQVLFVVKRGHNFRSRPKTRLPSFPSFSKR